MSNFSDIFNKVDKMTGEQLRGYEFHFIDDDYIFERRMPERFCYGSECSILHRFDDELDFCRAGDDGLVSPACERYWEVSEVLRDMVFADMVIRRWFDND